MPSPRSVPVASVSTHSAALTALARRYVTEGQFRASHRSERAAPAADDPRRAAHLPGESSLFVDPPCRLNSKKCFSLEHSASTANTSCAWIHAATVECQCELVVTSCLPVHMTVNWQQSTFCCSCYAFCSWWVGAGCQWERITASLRTTAEPPMSPQMTAWKSWLATAPRVVTHANTSHTTALCLLLRHTCHLCSEAIVVREMATICFHRCALPHLPPGGSAAADAWHACQVCGSPRQLLHDAVPTELHY